MAPLGPVPAAGIIIMLMAALIGEIYLLQRFLESQNLTATSTHGPVENSQHEPKATSPSSEATAVEETTSVNSQVHRWLVYMLYGILIQIAATIGLAVVPMGSNPLESTTTFSVVGLIYLAGNALGAIGYLLGFYVYIVDGKAVKRATGSFPNRGLYLLGHLLLAPITALLYLSKRDSLVGNDYEGTLADSLPFVGSS